MEKIILIIISIFIFKACGNLSSTSKPKEKYNLQFKLSPEIDTLFYKVEYKPYRVDSLRDGFTRKIYICLSKSQNDTLIGTYKNLVIKNDSIYRNENRSSFLVEKKQLDSIKIRTWTYILFFNLPSEKVYENYEWDFKSHISANNIHKEDFKITSKGCIKKIYADSLETYLDIEYRIEVFRDIDGKNYPEEPLMYSMRIKDERCIIGKGKFMLNEGRWENFEIYQKSKNYYPNQDSIEANMVIELIDGKPYK